MKIVIAQCNPTIGDFKGNCLLLQQALNESKTNKPDLIVFSELFLTGYPPRDLLERSDFIEAAGKALNKVLELSKSYPDTGILVGTILPTENSTGNGLYNIAVLIENEEIQFIQRKSLLPTYDVFDEARYFDPAEKIQTFLYKGENLGITICEDAWNHSPLLPRGKYPVDPIEILSDQNATLYLNLSASPYQVEKPKMRYDLVRRLSLKLKKPFILVNQVGGNDELVFDGNSLAFNHKGICFYKSPSFKSALHTINTSIGIQEIENISMKTYDIEEVYQALSLGLKDYIHRCGFSKVVIGLSGGIDSAVVCAIATQSLGSQNVLGITMPSKFSSQASVDDAKKLANHLGISFKIISIENLHQDYLNELTRHFENLSPGIAEENIQARIRGNILMAFSNKFGYLTLSTGNKSELAIGYCTLYGDMSGGLGVIADVPKTMVYELAGYINRDQEIIPKNTITKPPSAELKPDQKDEDTLPPYPVLDKILNSYLDNGKSKSEMIAEGLEPNIIDWVIKTIWKNEYKRRQAAPALKITSKAFGMGRRMPIAIKWSV